MSVCLLRFHTLTIQAIIMQFSTERKIVSPRYRKITFSITRTNSRSLLVFFIGRCQKAQQTQLKIEDIIANTPMRRVHSNSALFNIDVVRP